MSGQSHTNGRSSGRPLKRMIDSDDASDAMQDAANFFYRGSPDALADDIAELKNQLSELRHVLGAHAKAAAETSVRTIRDTASKAQDAVDPPSLDDVRRIVAEQLRSIDLSPARKLRDEVVEKAASIDWPDMPDMTNRPEFETAKRKAVQAAKAVQDAPAPQKYVAFGLSAGAVMASLKFGYDRLTHPKKKED